ncbi:hypothetical protein ACFQ1Q_11020 [Winogradskyella litorisediminis]|uniref:Anti-sigma factor n=1 Tax=Winogradskyella litorisediminis TaxID=1156618 RepID=A0ABW3N8F1_9FLAO
MKEKDEIDNLFDDLKGQFDIKTPDDSHEARFLNKLEAQTISDNTKNSFWKPFLAIAASVMICLSVFQLSDKTEEKTGLASVSEEMAETQDFFTATINEELKKLNAERSPLTQQIIYEAERQLKALEKDYAQLKIDLKQSGNDKRVIYAMISNYQSRIDILNNILQQIEDLKQTKYETQQTL